MAEKAIIHINDVIGLYEDEDNNRIQGVMLLDVMRQFSSYQDPSEILLMIDTPGGDIAEGDAIAEFLKQKNLPITTKVTRRAYSMGSILFLLGDIRLIEKNAKIMIHMPWGGAQGSGDYLIAAGTEIKALEDRFTKHYNKYLNADESSIRRLLTNETYITAEEAVDLRLATGTYSEMKAVAFYNDNNQPKTEETIMTKAEKLAKALASFIKGDGKSTEQPEEVQIVALTLQDANGEEVEFPELDENMTPEAGSKITKDGEPFEGEVLMPDGSKIIAFNGIVEEVVPAPEEEEAPAEQPVQEEAVAQEEVEEEVDFTALFAQMEAKIMDKVRAEHKEEKEALNAEILALKKEIGSSIDNDPAPAKINDPKSGNFLTNALKNRRK